VCKAHKKIVGHIFNINCKKLNCVFGHSAVGITKISKIMNLFIFEAPPKGKKITNKSTISIESSNHKKIIQI
jgi:hypothetical protein